MEGQERRSGWIDLATAPEGEIEAALVHFDELSAANLELLARDPIHGPRLGALQLAEAWLSGRAAGPAPPAVRACPSADELFDYGRGPGYRPLTPERRAELDRHTLRCDDCRGFAASLQRRPPVPLEILPLLEPAAPAPAAAERTLPRLRLLRTALPLAAAAAVLFLARPSLRDAGEAPPGLPARPILRDGAGAANLLLPRGALLFAPGAGLERRVELAPVPRADHYRVQLLRHGGGAFETGEPIGELVSEEPSLGLPDLAPGRYTYAAWVHVDGLDQPLGERDFQVVERPALAEALGEAGRPGSAPEAELRRLILELDAAGLVTDARALARLLPASPEREAYLAAPPR